MTKQDGRSLSAAGQHQLRRLVVRLARPVLNQRRISHQVGVSYNMVRVTLDAYESGGMAALLPRRVGRKPGTLLSLTAEQEALIQRLI